MVYAFFMTGSGSPANCLEKLLSLKAS